MRIRRDDDRALVEPVDDLDVGTVVGTGDNFFERQSVVGLNDEHFRSELSIADSGIVRHLLGAVERSVMPPYVWGSSSPARLSSSNKIFRIVEGSSGGGVISLTVARKCSSLPTVALEYSVS